MNQWEKKISKLEPILKVRKLQLDHEIRKLAEIQRSKELAAQGLRQAQNTYISGIEKLNQERQSSSRLMLDALERGVDRAKSDWYKQLGLLKQWEEEERKQFEQLREAEKKMKMMEHLEERFHEENLELLKRSEQKLLDEVAIQNQRRKTSHS